MKKPMYKVVAKTSVNDGRYVIALTRSKREAAVFAANLRRVLDDTVELCCHGKIPVVTVELVGGGGEPLEEANA